MTSKQQEHEEDEEMEELKDKIEFLVDDTVVCFGGNEYLVAHNPTTTDDLHQQSKEPTGVPQQGRHSSPLFPVSVQRKSEKRRQWAEELEEQASNVFDGSERNNRDGVLDRVNEVEDLIYSPTEDVLREATDVLALALITEPEIVAAQMDTEALLPRLALLRFRYRPAGRDNPLIHEAATIALHQLSTVCVP